MRYWTKNKITRKKYLLFPLVMGYLLLVTVSQLTTPTTAYFTDSKSVDGKISASKQFCEAEKECTTKQKRVEEEQTKSENRKQEAVQGNTVSDKQGKKDEDITQDGSTDENKDKANNKKQSNELENKHQKSTAEETNQKTTTDNSDVNELNEQTK